MISSVVQLFSVSKKQSAVSVRWKDERRDMQTRPEDRTPIHRVSAALCPACHSSEVLVSTVAWHSLRSKAGQREKAKAKGTAETRE